MHFCNQKSQSVWFTLHTSNGHRTDGGSFLIMPIQNFAHGGVDLRLAILATGCKPPQRTIPIAVDYHLIGRGWIRYMERPVWASLAIISKGRALNSWNQLFRSPHCKIKLKTPARTTWKRSKQTPYFNVTRYQWNKCPNPTVSQVLPATSQNSGFSLWCISFQWTLAPVTDFSCLAAN